jgi:hypothetical protein
MQAKQRYEKFLQGISTINDVDEYLRRYYSTYNAAKMSIVEKERVVNNERLEFYTTLHNEVSTNSNFNAEIIEYCIHLRRHSARNDKRALIYINFKEMYSDDIKEIIHTLKNRNIEQITPQTKLIQTKTVPENPIVYVKDMDYLVANRYMHLRRSAIERNKEFDLTLDDVRDLLSTSKCAYTGIEMTDENTPDGTTDNPLQRSIDRLDPNKGYVKGNVYAVCLGVNMLKEKLFETSSPSGINIGFDNVYNMMVYLKSVGFIERPESKLIKE